MREMTESVSHSGYPQSEPIQTPKTELVIKAADSLMGKIEMLIERTGEASRKLYGPSELDRGEPNIAGESKQPGFFGELVASLKRVDWGLDRLTKELARLTDDL